MKMVVKVLLEEVCGRTTGDLEWWKEGPVIPGVVVWKCCGGVGGGGGGGVGGGGGSAPGGEKKPMMSNQRFWLPLPIDKK